MNQTEVKRIEFIDALKGLSIFLVLWFHAGQWGEATSNFTFKFILSFNMPLFYIISGFFFKSSLRLKPKDFLNKKSFQLLYPWFIWCILLGIYQFVFHELDNTTLSQKLILIFNRWFWFLRELFLSYVITYIGYKVFKKGYLVALCCILFVVIVPFLKLQSYYLPLFLFGILLKDKYSLILNHINKIFYISFFIFVCCLFFWDNSYMLIYPNLFSHETFRYDFDFTNLYIPAFRWLAGISGTLFFFALFQKTYNPNNIIYSYFNKKGRLSKYIYLIHEIFLEILLPKYFPFPKINLWAFSLIIAPLTAFILIEFCIFLFRKIEKSKHLKTVLFGKLS